MSFLLCKSFQHCSYFALLVIIDASRGCALTLQCSSPQSYHFWFFARMAFFISMTSFAKVHMTRRTLISHLSVHLFFVYSSRAFVFFETFFDDRRYHFLIIYILSLMLSVTCRIIVYPFSFINLTIRPDHFS